MWLNGQLGTLDPAFSYVPVRHLTSGNRLLDRLWLLMPEDHYLNEAEVLRENGNQVVPPWALNPLLTRWATAKTAALEAEVRTKFRLPTELWEVLYKIESEAMGEHELDQHIFAYQFAPWQHPFTIISCYTYITCVI